MSFSWWCLYSQIIWNVKIHKIHVHVYEKMKLIMFRTIQFNRRGSRRPVSDKHNARFKHWATNNPNSSYIRTPTERLSIMGAVKFRESDLYSICYTNLMERWISIRPLLSCMGILLVIEIWLYSCSVCSSWESCLFIFA